MIYLLLVVLVFVVVGANVWIFKKAIECEDEMDKIGKKLRDGE